MSKPGIRIQNEASSNNDAFQLLLLGNFCGHNNASDKVIQIDRDTLEETMVRLAPSLSIRLSDDIPDQTIHFNSLEDFEPDRLLDQLEIFSRLKDIRGRLKRNDTFSQAAAELGYVDDGNVGTPNDVTASSDSLFDTILDTTPQTASPASNLEAYIRQIVAPYRVPAAHPATEELISQVDTAITGQMRQILHHADFQELESSWRCLDMLVRGIETGSHLRIHMLHMTPSELREQLSQTQSPLYKLLSPSYRQSGSTPYSMVVSLHSFEHTLSDIQSLSQAGVLAHDAGCYFVTSASNDFIHDGELLSTKDHDEWRSNWTADEIMAWNHLRESTASSHLILSLPSYLARLPYGAATSPARRFNFEEIGPNFGESDFLWSPSSALIALVFAHNFMFDGWNMQIPPASDIGGMPVFYFKDEYGDSCALSPAQTPIYERGAAIIRELGLSSIWWIRDSDRIQLALHTLSTIDQRLEV